MNSVANFHKNPANGSIILILHLKNKDSGSLVATYHGEWVKKKRGTLGFLGKYIWRRERQVHDYSMIGYSEKTKISITQTEASKPGPNLPVLQS